MPQIILPALHLNIEYLKYYYKAGAIALIVSLRILDFNKINNIFYSFRLLSGEMLNFKAFDFSTSYLPWKMKSKNVIVGNIYRCL